MQLDLDTRGGQFTIGGQVDEVFLLHVELAELSLELLSEQLLGACLVGDRRFQALLHGGDELARKSDGLVVRFDGTLDPIDVRVGCIASVILDTAAEEVGILTSIASGGAHKDHAFDDVVFESAAPAPDGAL